jgi:hypothetical protein
VVHGQRTPPPLPLGPTQCGKDPPRFIQSTINLPGHYPPATQASVYGSFRTNADVRLTASKPITYERTEPIDLIPDIYVGTVAFLAGPVPISISFSTGLKVCNAAM